MQSHRRSVGVPGAAVGAALVAALVAPAFARAEQYVAVSSGWGGGVPIWGGEVAKKFANVSQGGMLWVFKLAK